MNTVKLLVVTMLIVAPNHGSAATTLFRDVTTAAGLVDPGAERGIAWGDYDGDGDPDFLVAVLDGPDRLYRNDGAGRFSEVSAAVGLDAGSGSTAPAWCDFDGDGDLDLFVAGIADNHLYRNDEGAFVSVGPAAGLTGSTVSWSAAWADYDGDGRPDLYVANFSNMPNQLYHNLGHGRFADVAATVGVGEIAEWASASWADVDADGDPDLYVANKTGANVLYRNEAGGSFIKSTVAADALVTSATVGSVWGDADGDGDPDLFVSQALSADRLFLNQGTGRFVAAGNAGLGSPGQSRGIGLADIDNDGDIDLHIACADGPNLLYRNDGAALFTDISAGSGLDDSGTGTALAWADMDGDGDLDLLLSNFGSRLSLFENTQQSGNHWLAVDLRSEGLNSHGLGAVVRVYFSGGTLARQQTTGGGGYQSQQPSRVHFGLGGAAQVDSVTVKWPSGAVSRLGECAADTVLVVRGGRSGGQK